jgi:poly-gamma-glutamate capsule biosynthesis protein CapA/YwtB (metallophosphatase superfamily)
MDDILVLGKYIKSNKYITILNLEAPLKGKYPIKKWINLFQEENIFTILKILNVKAVNLANNHIMDWGEEGLKKTIK